jgi:predicted Zn-dependent protease
VGLTRREFLKVAGLSSAALLTGCAANPVSGEKQLILLSEKSEIAIDKEHSPHQFSTDYGVSGDAELNAYLDDLGKSMAAKSHRPQMPYSFRAVNAAHVNAYAFPGGTIAATRGILVKMDDEAELAGLMGHEIAHVNWRHTAQRMSTQTLIGLALAGVTGYAQSRDPLAGQITSVLGGVGAGALLAGYSRSDEREADDTGMEYMVRSGYDPRGMVGLMEMLNGMHDREPSALDLMFATHPMSSERLATARESASGKYARGLGGERGKDRYKDATANLRKIEPALKDMEKGNAHMAAKQYNDAATRFKSAIQKAPGDYCAHVLMAECSLARRDLASGLDYAREARAINNAEPRAIAVTGLLHMERKDYGSAYESFKTYQARLPGNPNMVFGMGMAAEGMGDRRTAAAHYVDYLQLDNSSGRARHAYERLVDWGVIEQPQG